MSHLTSRSGSGVLPSQRKLLAYKGHLAVIKKVAQWLSKEFVVTPSYERYTSAAAYAKFLTETEKNHQLDNLICRRVRELFNAQTVVNWVSGHKSCFIYWARGDIRGPNPPPTPGIIDGWSFDPYWAIKTDKTGTAAEAEGALVDGCGASWTAAYFNLYALPLNKMTGLSVKLRFYNPSLLAYDWYESGSYRIREVNVPPASSVGTGSLNMKYNFSADLGAPSSFDTSGDAAAAINFSDGNVVNEGKMSSFSMDGDNFCRYNPWNSTILSPWSMSPTIRYRHSGTSDTEYHADVAITSTMLNKLKRLQLDGSGGFWLTIGPSAADFFTTNLKHGYCAMMYFSRVELVISMTQMDQFNS